LLLTPLERRGAGRERNKHGNAGKPGEGGQDKNKIKKIKAKYKPIYQVIF
jgi:ABC-type cobalt transport system substrate-binding protein